MAIQQWVATGKGLNKPDQGVVNRLIAMGVVFAEDVTDDAGALPIGAVRGEPQFLHGIENPALNRFQAVAGIGQCPAHDHAHGVFEVGALHLLMQSNRFNALLSHVVRLFRRGRRSAYRCSPALFPGGIGLGSLHAAGHVW